jgi:hypothetical protein
LTPAFVDRAGYDLRPAAGSPVINAGSVPVAITATDNRAVSRIIFRVDGREVARSANRTLNFSWNTKGMNGKCILSAVAFDAANNQSSTSVTVWVRG